MNDNPLLALEITIVDGWQGWKLLYIFRLPQKKNYKSYWSTRWYDAYCIRYVEDVMCNVCNMFECLPVIANATGTVAIIFEKIRKKERTKLNNLSIH